MKSSMDEVKCYAPGGTLEVVLDILKALPPGRVLDAPCGQGAAVIEDGGRNEFLCIDIDKENFKLEDVPFLKVDMNAPLPLGNHEFDYVLCLEGIEHLENPFLCLREFGRVLKPGGSLIISTPNIMTIKSRFRFFFYSYHDSFRYIKTDDTFRHGSLEYEHEHINPMTFMELRYGLAKAGLEVTAVRTNRYVRAKKLGIFYPFFKRLIISRTRSKTPRDPLLVSRELLEGEILIIHARKSIAP